MLFDDVFKLKEMGAAHVKGISPAKREHKWDMVTKDQQAPVKDFVWASFTFSLSHSQLSSVQPFYHWFIL